MTEEFGFIRQADLPTISGVPAEFGHDVVRLVERIHYLQRHPRILKSIAGDNIGASKFVGAAIMLPLQAETHKVGKDTVVQGYRMAAERVRPHLARLTIGEWKSLGWSLGAQAGWTIAIVHEDSDIKYVDVASKEFFAYDLNATYAPNRAFDAFMAEHTTFDPCGDNPAELVEEYARLAAARERGPGGWDYPDRLYQKPHSVVLASLVELGEEI